MRISTYPSPKRDGTVAWVVELSEQNMRDLMTGGSLRRRLSTKERDDQPAFDGDTLIVHANVKGV